MLVGRHSGLSTYNRLVSQSCDQGGNLTVFRDYDCIEVLHPRGFGVCEESKPMTFVVKHTAASNELPCFHSLKTVLLKAVILIW